MKDVKITLFLILICIGFYSTYGGILQFTGYYNGKNVFIENELNQKNNEYCITNVYVNSKHILNHPNSSITEVNLSSFKLGDTLVFRIYHKEGCIPKVVNKHDIEAKTNHFAFNDITINEQTIHWKTKGEELMGKFSLEQLINGQWKIIQTLKATGTKSINSYNVANHTLSGDNKYRIKYKASGGLLVTSNDFYYHSTKTPVVFYPKRVVDFITFESTNHREVDFAVLDETGNPLFEGKAMLVDCRHLPTNRFYIIRYENKEERFFKKVASEVESSPEKK